MKSYAGAEQKPSEQEVQQLHLLLADPKFQRAVAAYKNNDGDYDTAYLAGSSDDGTKVFFDRDFVDAIKRGEVELNGEPYDPRPFIHIHEAVEGAILHGKYTPGIWQLKGDHFEEAHKLALYAERLAVEEALGDVWPEYIKSTEQFIKEDTPQEVPEPPPDIMREGDEKQSGARAEPYEHSKITRDAFLYLDGETEDFAQCGSCWLWNSADECCNVLGKGFDVKAEDSCGYWGPGPYVEQESVERFTPEEVGFVGRQVRCENCAYFKPAASGCHLYLMLNEAYPDEFDLDVDVEAKGCCNAQTPKE